MSINITMPALSPTMTEGTLARWLKKEGDKVAAGDVIAEIETDKATMEVQAVDEGILGKILIAGGTENVAVNAVIAVLLEEGEKMPDVILSANEGSKKVDSLPTAQNDKVMNTPLPVKDEKQGDRVFASPLAKRIAKEKGIDLSKVKGSGPHGRIVKEDVISHQGSAIGKQKAEIPISDHGLLRNVYGMAYKEITNNNIRKVVAKRLLESKQTVPHFYLTIECMLDTLLAARAELNERANGKFKLSVNDFIIKASAMALKAYPAANVSWTDAAILQYVKSDISVAVATPNGLITPIIRDAEDKGLAQISTEMKDLAARAREGKLKPEEFQGGSFSISNLGMFGVKEFGAIINPPQGCILAVGAGEERAVVIKGKIEIRTMMNCTLSVDHRCVDGAVGAEYLQIFKQYIENPVSMLV